MSLHRNGSTLFKVLVAIVIIAAVLLVYFIARFYISTPAGLVTSASVVDYGQTVTIAVSWSGGQAPYTLILYASPTSACTTSSPQVNQKPNAPTPEASFPESPTSTTYYCAQVVSPSGSSALSAAVRVIVNPALLPPTLSVSPSAIDVGQKASMTAKVTWTGGTSPFTITLLSGSNATCSQDTTVAGVSSGTNPWTGVSGSPVNFELSSPSATVYYCAAVQEGSSASSSHFSSSVQFVVNSALSTTIVPSNVSIDIGQTVTLTASASAGTPKYEYQWYSGGSCAPGSQLTGMQGPTYTAAGLVSSSTFSVRVNDSSTGTPAATTCAAASVTVNSNFANTTVQISQAQTIDSGMKAKLAVTWNALGTSPYSVQLTTSESSACSKTVPVVGANKTGLTVTTESFSVSPSTTTYYCATVADAATPHETASTSSSVLVTVNPSLSATIFLSPAAIDSGQSATVSATVSLTGGTAPYVVTLFSGSSSTCASDTTQVASPASSSSSTDTFKFSSPSVETYYCATVTDSLSPPASAMTNALEFAVNPVLAVTISPTTPSTVTGKTASLTAVVATGTGTSPYTYQWYNGKSCVAASAIGKQTGSALTTPALNATTSYSVQVVDSSIGTPASAGIACASTTVIVTPALTVTLFQLSPPMTDTGQSTTLKVTAQWTGGTSPYSTTLTSGTSATCSKDTTTVTVTSGTNPTTSTTGTTESLSFNAPTTTTYYCFTVKDSATPQAVMTSSSVFTVNPALAAPTLVLSSSVLDVGQTTTVTGSVTMSGGTPPYAVTLYSGSSSACTSDTLVVRVNGGSNPRTNVTGSTMTFSFTSPVATSYYCVVVKDNATSPVTSTSTASLFTVDAGLTASISSPSPDIIDWGQSTSVTVTVTLSGGASPYTVTLYSGSSATCSSDTTLVAVAPGSNPVTGFTGTTTTFTLPSPSSSTYYCATVKDSSSAPATAATPTEYFVVNPAFTAPVIEPSSLTVDSGATVTLTTATPFGGGTYPYTCQWLQEAPGASSYSSLGGPLSSLGQPFPCIQGSYPSTPTATLSTVGVWNFELEVKDSSSTPNTVFSIPVSVTVNPDPTATISITPTVLDSGQPPVTVTATVTWSGGTSPYTVTLYSGSSATCSSDTVVVSSKSSLRTTSTTFSASPSSTTYYCAAVVDSASPATTASTSTAKFTVNPTLAVGTLVLSPTVLDSGQPSVTVTATVTWSGGSSPYTATLYSGSSPTTCSSDTTVVAVSAGSNPQTGLTSTSASFSFASPGSTTYYCASVKDSAAAAAASSPSTFTVDPALTPPVIVSDSSTAVDVGQVVTLSTTSSFSGGTSSYTCQWLQEAPGATAYSSPGSSFPCTSSSLPTVSPTLSTVGAWSFELQVKDSSSTPNIVASVPVSVMVNADPTVTISISPNVLDYGLPPVNVTATVTWSGGTLPYNVTLYSGSSTTCSSTMEVVNVSVGSNPQTGLTGTSTSFKFMSPSSTTYYCASLVDSASPTRYTAYSATVEFTISAAPSLPVLGSGHNTTVGAAVTSSGATSLSEANRVGQRVRAGLITELARLRFIARYYL